MNYFFYESLSKEKIKNYLEEGLRGQAYYSSGAPKSSLLRGLPKLIGIIIGILGILIWLLRADSSGNESILTIDIT